MKIVSYELFQVPPRWLFLKIETDTGIVGWGEPVIEGRAGTVAACVKELMDTYIMGEEASNIEGLWQIMYRAGFYRGGPILMSAISGIDQALWDIKGKHLNVPIYELLGGKVRDKIKVYSWIGGDKPDDIREEARLKYDQGFRAIKMNGTSELDYIDDNSKVNGVVERVKAIRDELGEDFGIAVDFHGRVHKPMVKRLIKALEPYNLMFIEEPVLDEHIETFETISTMFATPIATGERMYSRFDFKPLFEARGVDIIQPDLSHAGGITECRKIATMAEAYDIALAPHCPLGPIALAACLQIDAVSHNAVIQEQSLGIHYNEGNDILDYLVDKKVFKYSEGYVKIPTGPGLGIEVDEEKIRELSKKGHNWIVSSCCRFFFEPLI